MDHLQEDIARVEQAIRALRVEFSKFFAGALERPPYTLQTPITTTLNSLLNGGGGENRRTVDQFRLNSLNAKFNSLAEMWNKNVRNLEEGRPSALQRQSSPGNTQERTPEELCRVGVRAAGATPDDPAIKKLYDTFLRASRQTGAEKPSLSYQSFYAQISRRLEKHHRKGHEELTFRVCVVDNRPILKLGSGS